MSEKTVRTIRLVAGITLSVLLVVSGLLLILSCISIYQSGDRPFTPVSIGTHFAAIQVPLYVTLAAIVAGIVLHLCLPLEPEKKRIVHDRRATLARLARRADTTDPAYAEIAKKETRLRTLLTLGAVIVTLLCTVPFLIHLFTYGFTADYNASVIAAMPTLLIASFAGVAAGTAWMLLRDASLVRQTDALKRVLSQGGKAPTDVAPQAPTRKNTLTVALRIGILAAGIVLLVLGILNGGMADVLDKAINICTECIGLG